MSLINVRSYFRGIVKSQDFDEWVEPFNLDIPDSILDRAFHVQIDEVSGETLNADNQTIIVDVIVRMFFKGFRTPDEAIDQGLVDGQNIIEIVSKPTNRLQTEIKNVKFNSMEFEPLDESNDNAIIVKQNYSVSIEFCY